MMTQIEMALEWSLDKTMDLFKLNFFNRKKLHDSQNE